MSIAWVYAGQGSQRPKMGADLYEAFPAFAAVIDRVETVVPGLKEVMFGDDAVRLARTAWTQPALAAFAAGVTAVLAENGLRPAAAAGLSLGEYSALHAAGVWDAETLVGLTAFRGAAMERGGEGSDGCMSAVIGMPAEKVEEICREVSESGERICREASETAGRHGLPWFVTVANYNTPAQIVIAGSREAVACAEAQAKAAGARRCIRLQVSGAFHSPQMRPAAEELHRYFRTISFEKPAFPVISNVTARPYPADADIPGLLEQQVQSPVRMVQSIRYLSEMGIDEVIEIGPGQAIAGMIRKVDRRIRVVSVETVEDLRNIIG